MTRGMRRLLEDSTLLRTVYFVRIKSPFAKNYNIVYPLLLLTFFLAGLIISVPDLPIWVESGVIDKLNPVLSLLFPFYVAALAAVSTFPGTQDLDRPFPPDSQGRLVTLEYRGDNGAIEPQLITQRHFLSLLFGYCSVSSVVLLLIGSFSVSIISALGSRPCDSLRFFSWFLFGLFMFMFFQMVMLTLLSIYYLGDKIHRGPVPNGNDLLSEDATADQRGKEDHPLDG